MHSAERAGIKRPAANAASGGIILFLQLLISALTVGCIYALIALSFNMMFASTRILNFSMGEVSMLGALFGVTFYSFLNLPYILVFILTVLTMVVFGMIVHLLAFEPLIRRHANQHSLILITLGLSMLFTHGAASVWGKTVFYVEAPLGSEPVNIFGAFVLPQSFLVIGVTVLALLLLWYFYGYTRTGRNFRAVAINREAASLMGIHVSRVVMIAFALSSGLAALAGLIFSPLVPTGSYMGATLGIKGFSAAIVGGMGNNLGAVIGGLLIGIVETFGAGYITAGYRDAFAFLVMLFILFVMPKGLFGKKAGFDD